MESEYLLKRRAIMQGEREKDPPKERKPIPRMSDKKKAEIADSKAMQMLDKAFYLEIWNACGHVCQCGCAARLGKEPLSTMFHHLLPKAQYPEFRHTPENIVLLFPDCHAQVEVDIDKRPEVKRRRDYAAKLLLG